MSSRYLAPLGKIPHGLWRIYNSIQKIQISIQNLHFRQAALRARRQEAELAGAGSVAADLETAEKMFFDTVRRIKLERERRRM